MSDPKHERAKSLKALKKLATQYLDVYKDLGNQQSNKWIDRQAKHSTERLKRIILDINYDLHSERLAEFEKASNMMNNMTYSPQQNVSNSDFKVNNFPATFFSSTNYFSVFEIIRLAPETNIPHDITWLQDGTVKDYFEIASGEKKLTYLEKYLPTKLVEVEKNIIPYLENIPAFQNIISIIRNAISHSKKNDFISSNILLITLNEGIVRLLAKMVLIKQKPDLGEDEVEREIYQSYTSLENLILKPQWDYDYPMDAAIAMACYKHVDDVNLNTYWHRINDNKDAQRKLKHLILDAKNNFLDPNSKTDEYLGTELKKISKGIKDLVPNIVTEEDSKINVNLRIMLDFLARKYKDDRNLLAHGNFNKLEHKFNNYINFSALVEVCKVYKNYDIFYKNKSQ